MEFAESTEVSNRDLQGTANALPSPQPELAESESEESEDSEESEELRESEESEESEESLELEEDLTEFGTPVPGTVAQIRVHQRNGNTRSSPKPEPTESAE